MIVWDYDDLMNWIKNGYDKNIGEQVISLNISENYLRRIPNAIYKLKQLQKFDCSNNQIKKISKKICKLTQSQTFDCSHNQIKKIPKEISTLTHLQSFKCNYNKIKKIPKEITNLKQLEDLECSNNNIKKIPKKISNLIKLQCFICDKNNIMKIPKEIHNLTQLECFELKSNKIMKIPKEIGNLTQLQIFNVSNNCIKKIPKEIGNSIQLLYLDCSNNQIKKIPMEIMNCVNLIDFIKHNNEIENIHPRITRWINGFNDGQQIYADNQSVHNHAIQEGVSNSINYIMSLKTNIKNEKLKKLIINNQYLDEHTKRLLFEYMDNKEVHSVLNITFEELLLYVYSFIERNENKEELYKIMNVEISEANCKCFTGRISRLINVLNGYDEHIKIHISDNEQIGNVISIIRTNLGDNYEETEFKRLIHEELSMRQYSEDVINEWINNI